MKLLVLTIILSSLFTILNSYKILLVENCPSASHYFLVNTLAKGLANLGHDVTIISPFKEKNPPINGTYREIFIEQAIQKVMGMKNIYFELEKANPFKITREVSKFGTIFTEIALKEPEVQDLIKSNEQFDVVIVEQFVNDALKAFAYHFNAPLIIFSTTSINNWINPLVGNPSPPSYIPELFLKYGSKMNLWQRMFNFIFRIYNDFYRHYYFIPEQNKIMKKYFPNVPNLDILYYNTSIVLINSHESINQAVPHVPNMIDIAGMHITPPGKLPNHLQKFIDEAEEGVIYFSLGSNLRSSDMKNETVEAFIEAFKKTKMKVLWKWDNDELPGKPSNIKIGKWFPQNDILGHPNIKLFMTHGGLLSITESVYHGVPIFALPIYGDQKLNAKQIEDAGIGLKMYYDEVAEEKVTKNLREVLYNPKYRKEAKRRSTLLQDRPIKPLNLCIYWVEYVARHKVVDHLRVEGIHLSWFEYLSLDVITVLVLLFLCNVCFGYFIVVTIYCKFSYYRKKIKLN